MAEALSIKRRKKTDSPLGFDSLRSEAIKQIQRYSGKVWTDYNLHDPGITILEQLIYAITDLTYRTDFDLEDLLADGDGHVDLESLNLHAPFEVLPCRATTLLDYRKLLLDAVPVLDNVWITDMADQDGADQDGADQDGADQDGTGQPYRGLYRLALKFAQNLDEHARKNALEQVRATYLGARNLCEDLGEVIIVDTLEYELCADIEVNSSRNPADTLAEIYFECARRIASSVTISNYDQLEDQDRPLDQLFDGPGTRYGFFRDEDLREHQSEFLVSTLIATINSIEGVDHIRQLYLARGDESFYDRIGPVGPEQAFDLAFPRSAADIGVGLTTNGRKLPIALDELAARYHEINFKYHSSRSTPQDMSLLFKPISGVSRPLHQYFSIQNHFPVSYGVNQQGIPASAPTEVKAKARQLKAYLLIFEQLLNNFLANLDSVKILFSSQIEPRRSYATQALGEQQVADLNAVYPQDPDAFLGKVVAGFDNYNERKNRLLDYLLALYGERVSQIPIRQFNFYHGETEIEEVIIANKVAYLNAIVELGRDRGAAPDYSVAPAERRAGGVALRIAMMLEFEQRSANALTSAMRDQGIEICPHQDYLQQKAGSEEMHLVAADEMPGSGSDSFEQPPLMAVDENVSLQSLRDGIASIPVFDGSLMSDLLLREGIYIEQYRVGRLQSTQDYQLIFQGDREHYWNLASYPDKPSAMRAANDLRRYLVRLNKESEGLHIVENILLRPELRPGEAQSDLDQGDDFYSFRTSVVFSGWTARCQNPQFRLLAEETLSLNLPAHVLPEFYWLDFPQMTEFEALNEKWQQRKSDTDSSPMEVDDSARRLISFLRELRNTQQTGEATTSF